MHGKKPGRRKTYVLDTAETLVHSGFGDGKDGVPFLQMNRLYLPAVNKGFGNPQRITIKDILFLCEVMMMQKEDKKKLSFWDSAKL